MTNASPFRFSRGDGRRPSGRFGRRLVLWLALALVWFNVAGGALLSLRPAGVAQPRFAQDLLDDRIVICTAAGMVVLDRNGDPIDASDAQQASDFCAFCLPLAHGGKAPIETASALSTPAAVAESAPTPLARASFKPAILTGSGGPRAPPYV